MFSPLKEFNTFLKWVRVSHPSSNRLAPEMPLCCVPPSSCGFYILPRTHTLFDTNTHKLPHRLQSVSCITFCQTSVSIEDTSFNERHTLPAAVFPPPGRKSASTFRPNTRGCVSSADPGILRPLEQIRSDLGFFKFIYGSYLFIQVILKRWSSHV